MTENKNITNDMAEKFGVVSPSAHVPEVINHAAAEAPEKPAEEAKPDKNDPEYIRVCRFMRAIFTLCDLSGYHVEERITLKSKKSGRIFK